MEVFVDVITREGNYTPARVPTWCEAGVGKVVPFACRFALRAKLAISAELGVFHLEELRFLQWPGFTETCVRNFDTLVVVACPDSAVVDAKAIEGYWLVTNGMERRAFFEAEAKLRAFENGPKRRRGHQRAVTING